MKDEELKILVDSSNNKKVEILDNETGHTIATRLIPDDGIINTSDKSFRIVGETKVNDFFYSFKQQ